MIRVILLSGAPGSGKTSIANELAKSLSINQLISTDLIREILRSSITKEEAPTLHTSAILACDWAPEGQNKMIWGFEQQARDVKLGIEAAITRSRKEKRDIILEGIHLIPGFLQGGKEFRLKHYVIEVSAEEQHRRQLLGQGAERASYKLEEFSKARAFQEFLVASAGANQAKIIINQTISGAVEEIIEDIKKCD